MAVEVVLGRVATWFPDSVLEIGDLGELGELTEARRQHALSLGIERIRDAGELTEVDLAERAARIALAEAGMSADEVDALLLVQGRAPEYLMASEATRLQARLGASRAFTTGVGELGCVSVSAALALGAALLRGQSSCETVLIAMGAKAPTAFRYRAPMTILGDGGAAVLLRKSGPGRCVLVDHALRSDGRYADLFRIDYQDLPRREWAEVCADEATYSFRLAVESRNRFTELNAELLGRNGLAPSRLAAVVMQNLSAGAFRFWEDALDLPIDKACPANLAVNGHLGSIDVLLNLEAAASSLAPGSDVLVMNSSPVAAWSSSLWRTPTG